MYNKLLYPVYSILVLIMISNVQALENFSIRPIHDSYVSNEPDAGPDTNHRSMFHIHASNTPTKRRVGYFVFDISELEGQPVQDVVFDFSGYGSGTVAVYGIIEELDELINENTITWNTAPGVKNEPAPPVGDPVVLDFNDLTDVLLRFSASSNRVESTEPNQALDDFISSDEDGIVVFMFAPAEEDVSVSIQTKESSRTNWYEGSYLKGLVVPPECAFLPNPANGKTEVEWDAVFSWTPGMFAALHNVYFGSDPNNLNHVATKALGEESYSPPEPLQFNQTYYWRIDEVNEMDPNSPWEGNFWSFTVANFIVVDDFEDYNEFPPDEIWNTWIDGFDEPANGSILYRLYSNSIRLYYEPYVPQKIVREGDCSMTFHFDNSVGFSEATRTFTSSMRDWTREDVVTLTLFYYGDSTNAPEPIYVAVDGDTIVVNDDPNAALIEEWTQWNIPLQIFTNQGVDLTDVNSMTIGFGNKADPLIGGSGFVFFDDIRLYR